MDNSTDRYQDVLAYFRDLDRCFFMDDRYKSLAGEDRAFPIGHGQTISQPSLVLQMTFLLELQKHHRVLEIGTGSGYQSALLAQFCDQLYTIERIPDLAKKARQRLEALGYKNVFFLIADGSQGWPQHAPYDRIIVTAGASSVPETLITQLVPGGILLIPVGYQDVQQLLKIHKDESGRIHKKDLGDVRFVEFVGKYGW